MRRSSLKTLRKYIPLYEQSTKIKEEDIESHDNRFHNQIKIFNVVLIIVYTVGVIMEFNSGIKGHYLIANVFLMTKLVTYPERPVLSIPEPIISSCSVVVPRE